MLRDSLSKEQYTCTMGSQNKRIAINNIFTACKDEDVATLSEKSGEDHTVNWIATVSTLVLSVTITPRHMVRKSL